MLTNLRGILNYAERNQMAIGAFNAPYLESALAIIEAAEELEIPVIIQHAQVHEPWMPMEIIGPVILELARKAKVPVCIHLDHGTDLDYIQKALEIGFTSVMYDGSVLPYEENLENTKKTVLMAEKYGASVEAELGSMGKSESGDGSAKGDETKIYTDPELAEQFVKETGIDALACSFGTTHGLYLEKPCLDFSVITKVRQRVKIPVVMHGGSGVEEEEFRKAIKEGVRKVNYFTYMDKAGGSGVLEGIEKADKNNPVYFHEICAWGREAMKQDVKAAMKVFAMGQEKNV